MRHVSFPGLPEPVSALGFGCASLGSRVSARVGRAAIERALDSGVTWFDVAPSYGDGNAEIILGDVVRGSNVAVATKVGIAARPQSTLNRLARNVARPIVAAVPGLRSFAKRRRPNVATREALTRDLILSSASRSLKRLGVGKLAMLALHEPNIDDVQNDSVIGAMHDVLANGIATQIGIAGAPDVFTAAMDAGFPSCVAQIAQSPMSPTVATLRRLSRAPLTCVTHSVFGVTGALGTLVRKTAAEPALAAAFQQIGYGVSETELQRLLLEYAFAANSDGIVILSSFNSHHLTANALAASRQPMGELAARVESLLS